MIILDQKGFSGLVKYILDLIFIGGIGILLSLPIALKWYLRLLYTRTSENYYFLLGFLFVTGILALTVVNEIQNSGHDISSRGAQYLPEPRNPCHRRKLRSSDTKGLRKN